MSLLFRYSTLALIYADSYILLYYILPVNKINMGGRHVANFNQMYHHYRNFMKTGRPVYKPPYISAAVYDLFRNSS